jgi:hypothetical protein
MRSLMCSRIAAFSSPVTPPAAAVNGNGRDAAVLVAVLDRVVPEAVLLAPQLTS